MQRAFRSSFILLSALFLSGFVPHQQNAANVSILNRENQPVTQITDGDTIQIKVTLPSPVTEQQKINFNLGHYSSIVGSCVITSGNDRCTTDAFPSLGWSWNPDGSLQTIRVVRAIHENGELIAQSNPINVRARPVVIVHGFISNWRTWSHYLGPDGYLASIGLQGFAVGDGQVNGELNTGSIISPASRTNTIAQNAEVLGQYIAEVKGHTGAEMVDLVVHSMGGMISRYYIDRVMQERDVAQLIMLGSPMGGSDCAVLPAALGFYLPASIEIREVYMTGVFNQQITHRRGIEFYDLGGTAISEPFKSPCTDVPNDTVVSFGSINAIELQSAQLEVIHSDLTSSETVFQDFVKPLLQKPAGSFFSASDPVPFEQTESPLQFTRVYTGHVDAGTSTELTINIEPGINVAAFALYDSSRSVTTVVRGASGNIIELDPQSNGFIRIDDPSSLFYLGYGFADPRPGPWNITLQTTETTPANGADFAISAYFVGGARLETQSSTLVPELNDRVEFTTNISLNGQALEIMDAQAVIKNAEGAIETIQFPAGRNVSVTWTPRNPGTHAVDVVVTGNAPDGSTIERTDFLAIEVQPNVSRPAVIFKAMLLMAIIVVGLVGVLYGIVRLIRRAHRSFPST
jgi:pimeloyl-ACP methyl ester carboxylesterase